eukprot:TRINITY_DN1927_c0_g1_i1.p1 TRINITY_DN1927_c0_g1~~TRINITY_DN1927_c0_g1_i1.p1  ORF type:complete len:109 (-),score=4.41 TRINITY_DN1927_c0_g1_i1:342-668(-)
MAPAQLVIAGLLLIVFAISGGAGKCMVAVFTDISGNDIGATSISTTLDCAVGCRDDRKCVAFVTSPQNECWLKYAWSTPSANPSRFVVYTGREDCTALFTDENGTAYG